MPHQDFKDLTRRTASDKILHEKAFNIAKMPIVIDIEGILIQPFLNLLIKKLQVKQLKMKLYLIKNKVKNYTNQLLENFKKEDTLYYWCF